MPDRPALSADGRAFVTVRALATLTTLRADGSPHVCPVGYTYDAEADVLRVITGAASQKAVNVGRDPRMVLCQVDGPRWLTLEGEGVVCAKPAEVADAVRRYAARYRQPRENPARVVLIAAVTRLLGSAALRAAVG